MSTRSKTKAAKAQKSSAEPAALTEEQLAERWTISVRTLRRWRQEGIGPVFCKLGSRVTYLVSEIDAYEQRRSRFGTSAAAKPSSASPSPTTTKRARMHTAQGAQA